MKYLEKSDKIICNNRAEMWFKANKNNYDIEYQQFNITRPVDIRDITIENITRYAGSERNICNELINSRGGNAVICDNLKPAVGYSCFTDERMKDYNTIKPCKTNTYQNYVACDDYKCCSIHHQLFMNITRRK